jgi:hypothetical protein
LTRQERLKLYAESHGLDLGRRTLLHADDDAARELAAALGIGYRPGRLQPCGGDFAARQQRRDRLPATGTPASSNDLLAKLKSLLEK